MVHELLVLAFYSTTDDLRSLCYYSIELFRSRLFILRQKTRRSDIMKSLAHAIKLLELAVWLERLHQLAWSRNSSNGEAELRLL